MTTNLFVATELEDISTALIVTITQIVFVIFQKLAHRTRRINYKRSVIVELKLMEPATLTAARIATLAFELRLMSLLDFLRECLGE